MTLTPKRSLGQNFLVDKNIIEQIVNSANINKNDIILEVGPGTGALTQKIFEKKPKKLIVIEKDEKLANDLNHKFGKKLKIINQDMMNVSYENLKEKNVIVFGNLPYNISTQILAKWIKIQNLPNFSKKFVLMFQKEVADRIIAQTNTKNYGRLSILSNWKMKIEKIIDVEPRCFFPSPKVKSSVLIFTPKNDFYKINDPKNLEYVTNIFFSQRRKMIKKPLRFLFKNFHSVSRKLSIELSQRPQNLDNLTYYKICELYEELIN